ncbi:MAG: hypothetical protein QI223_01245 [Candidatus Korarchaeota archaeon]|nr:hypothetical protein [Candidatus Korarchaeota archaeon]
MRAGISRVAVEVILLVLAVALALLIFSPVGSFIFSALGRTQLVGGTTTLEIISVDTANSQIYIKNQGPNTLTNALGTSATGWTVTFKTKSGETTLSASAAESSGNGDSNFDPGETAVLTISSGWPSDATQTDTFTVIVYGPEGTRAEYIYRP